VKVIPLLECDRTPSVAAAGVVMDPDEPTPIDMVEGDRQRGQTYVVVLRGAAVQRSSGVRLTAGELAVFVEDERLDLQVEDELHYWCFTSRRMT
jgi:hypothetical protein